MDGHFRHAHTRTRPRQTPPYRAMTDVLDDHCRCSALTSAKGCWSASGPRSICSGINVAGYHEHFVTDDRKGGGHLLDYQLDHGVLTFGEIHKLDDRPARPTARSRRLICTPDNLDAAIRSVEC
ncbi:acetolactate decarboxylase [Klebsiella pneumoniae]|nr:acetolactate decarboxylase [Klebsiella pneumoniae]